MHKLFSKTLILLFFSNSFLFGLNTFSNSIKKVRIATFYTYDDIEKFFNKYYNKFKQNNLEIPLYLTKLNKYYVLYTYMVNNNELNKLKKIINNILVFYKVNDFPFINKDTLIFIYSKNKLFKYDLNTIKEGISQLNIRNVLKTQYLSCYKDMKITNQKVISIPLKCLNFVYPLKDKNKRLIKINFNNDKFYKIFLIKKNNNVNKQENFQNLQQNTSINTSNIFEKQNNLINEQNQTNLIFKNEKKFENEFNNKKKQIKNILTFNNLKIKNFIDFIENNIKDETLKKDLIGIKNLPFDNTTFVFDKDIKTVILKASKNKEDTKNIQKQNNNNYKNKIKREEKEDLFISIAKTLYTILLIILNIILFFISIIFIFRMNDKDFERFFKGNVNNEDKKTNETFVSNIKEENNDINEINNDTNKEIIENNKIEQKFDFDIKQKNNNINELNENINKETTDNKKTNETFVFNIKEENNNINEIKIQKRDDDEKNDKQKQIEELKSLLKKPKIRKIRK